jgi:hypothetical protein
MNTDGVRVRLRRVAPIGNFMTRYAVEAGGTLLSVFIRVHLWFQILPSSQIAIAPPSTWISDPVMYDDSSDARNRIA